MRDRQLEQAALLLWIAAVCSLIWNAVSPGFLVDDLMLARYASRQSWGGILALEAGPFPFHVALWKIAATVSPASPFVPVRVFTALLHGVNALLVWRLFRMFVTERAAVLWAAAFLLYRPGNESFLWASGDAEAIALCFSLLAVMCWHRRGERKLFLFGSLAMLCCALLGKISAMALPAVLAGWTLWIERKPPGRMLRDDGPALGAALLLTGLAVALALLRPGTWDLSHQPAHPGVTAAASALGITLVRAFALVNPFRGTGALPAVAVAGAALVFLLADSPKLRLGLVWAAGFMGPSVAARGISQPRYAYAAAVGIVLILSALWELAREGGWRRSAAVLLGVWLAGNAVLGVRDVRVMGRCGRLNGETRDLVAERTGEIRSSGGLAVVNRSPLMRHTDILLYDHELDVPVRNVNSCGEAPGYPCLEYPRTVNVAKECPADYPFARWKLGT